MQFEARVFFDVASADTWRFYRLLAAAVKAGAELSMEWRPFCRDDAPDRDALAAFAHVQQVDPERHGMFIQALLTLHHANRHPLDWELVDSAAQVCGIERAVLEEVRSGNAGYEAVRTSVEEGVSLGVTRSPTLMRHGPVLYVKTTPAVLHGDPVARLEVIDRVLEDDGVWELSKP